MKTQIRTLTVAVSTLVVLAFGLFLVNQTAAVVELAGTVSPGFARGVLIALVTAYVLLLAFPIVYVMRLRKPLVVPDVTEGPEYDAYLSRLAGRLASNPRLEGAAPRRPEEITAAVGELDSQVDALVKSRAGRVFLATAISQSGRLDAFMVLALQLRMVWEIAHIYAQRPSLRELLGIYANVAATAFVAGSLEEIDPGEQITPILSAALPTVAGEIPGLRAAATVLTGAIVTGSANAFLTLRVGMVAKRMCSPLVPHDRARIRRAAVAEATRLLAEVVAAGSAAVSRSLWDASRSTVGSTVTGVAGIARGAGDAAIGLAKGAGNTAVSLVRGRREEPDATEES